MSDEPLIARALQLSERIELKGLERADQFSSSPLAFRVGGAQLYFSGLVPPSSLG